MIEKLCNISELEESHIEKIWFTIDIDFMGQKTGLITKHEGTLLDFFIEKINGVNVYENEYDAVASANF